MDPDFRTRDDPPFLVVEPLSERAWLAFHDLVGAAAILQLDDGRIVGPDGCERELRARGFTVEEG